MSRLMLAGVLLGLVLCTPGLILAQSNGHGKVGSGTLSAMGLGGMNHLSDAEGHAIRGKGFGGHNTHMALGMFNVDSDAIRRDVCTASPLMTRGCIF